MSATFRCYSLSLLSAGSFPSLGSVGSLFSTASFFKVERGMACCALRSRHCRPICEFNLGLSPRVFRTEGGELVVMDEQRQWHVCSLRVDE